MRFSLSLGAYTPTRRVTCFYFEGRNFLICAALFRLISPASSKSSTWSIIHCAWIARYSWAATSFDTADGSDRSDKNFLRFSTHSVSWKGSTGVVPFQAFLQLSTVGSTPSLRLKNVG